MSQKTFFLFFVLNVFLFSIFSLQKSFSQDISLLENINFSWQVINSYTPSFYEGRPLPGEQSTIKVVATPEIQNQNDNIKLYYDWYVNSILASNASGVGKNVFKFDLDQLENRNTVELKLYQDETKDTLLSNKSLTISAYDPVLLMYKLNDSSLITYSNSINKKYKNYTLSRGDSVKVLVEPFYFSINNSNDQNMSFFWNQNGVSGSQISKSIYNLKTPEYQYGDLSLKLKVSNSKQFLQESETVLNISLNN
jgi:hypothetical protein